MATLAAIDRGHDLAAQQAGARAISVGTAWERVLAASLPGALWQDDGSHPAPAGTSLAACVVDAAVFGESPVGLGDHERLPNDVAARVQQIAAGS